MGIALLGVGGGVWTFRFLNFFLSRLRMWVEAGREQGPWVLPLCPQVCLTGPRSLSDSR